MFFLELWSNAAHHLPKEWIGFRAQSCLLATVRLMMPLEERARKSRVPMWEGEE